MYRVLFCLFFVVATVFADMPQVAANSAGSYGGWFPGKGVATLWANRPVVARRHARRADRRGYGCAGSSGYGSSGSSGYGSNTMPTAPLVKSTAPAGVSTFGLETGANKAQAPKPAAKPAAADFYALYDRSELRQAAYHDWGLPQPTIEPKPVELLAAL